MKSLILILYEIFTTMIPFLFIYFVFKKKFNKKNNFLLLLLFFIYILLVLNITGAGTIYDFLFYGIDINPQQISIIPFKYQDFLYTGFILNIIMFIPLGFILPLIWGNKFRLNSIFIYGFLFSLFIELSQLLNNRTTDIDDLIANTAGAIIGYFIYRIFMKLFKINNNNNNNKIIEPSIYIAAIFLGRFLFFNEFALAKILYGF